MKWICTIIILFLFNCITLAQNIDKAELESAIISIDELISNSWIKRYNGIDIKFRCSYTKNINKLTLINDDYFYPFISPFYLSMTKDSVFCWDKINSPFGRYIIYYDKNFILDEVYNIKGTNNKIISNKYQTQTLVVSNESLNDMGNTISIEDLYNASFWRIDNVKLLNSKYKLYFNNQTIRLAKYKDKTKDYIKSSLFYLSSSPDKEVNLSKIKNTNGRYLIICNDDNSTIVAEIEKETDKKIKLKFKAFTLQLSKIEKQGSRK